MQNEKPRKLSSTVMGLLIIFSVLSVMNLTSMNVRASGVQYVNWSGLTNITSDETYPNSTYDSAVINLTDGDLTIFDGVTLTFNDNVKLNIKNNYWPGKYGIQVNNTAKFEVNSVLSTTTIKTHDSTEENTYWFTNSGTIDFL